MHVWHSIEQNSTHAPMMHIVLDVCTLRPAADHITHDAAGARSGARRLQNGLQIMRTRARGHPRHMLACCAACSGEAGDCKLDVLLSQPGWVIGCLPKEHHSKALLALCVPPRVNASSALSPRLPDMCTAGQANLNFESMSLATMP